MGRSLYYLWHASSPGIPKTIEEEKEEARMRRIFDLVPRRKRSPRGPKKNLLDFSKVPRKKRTVYTDTTPPKWLLRLKKEMKIVDDPILLIEKPLDPSDVDPSQNRLTIPFHRLQRNDFLTCDEWRILGDESINDDGKMGVGAFLVDKRTKQWHVGLKKCVRMTDSGIILRSYLLSGEWSDIVVANGLRDDDNISLWSFRLHGMLFFALDFAVAFGFVLENDSKPKRNVIFCNIPAFSCMKAMFIHGGFWYKSCPVFVHKSSETRPHIASNQAKAIQC